MTKRSISAALRGAGFTAAQRLSSKLRGFPEYGPGFRVLQGPEGIFVQVSGRTGPTAAATLDGYYAALNKKYTLRREAARILITGLRDGHSSEEENKA